MKRVLLLCISMILLLSACSKELKYSAPGWELQVSSPKPYDLTFYEDICAEFTDTYANFRSSEENGTQLILIEGGDFAVGIYTNQSNTYRVYATNLRCACDGLSQIVDAYSLAETSPKVYEVVQEVDDGWGTRTINGEKFAWPDNATSSLTGWETDGVTLEIVQYTEKEDATSIIEEMKSYTMPGFKLWYYGVGSYQGIAWYLNGEYYISLALYRQHNTMYLTLSGQDNMDYALELAERYDMEVGMKGLLTSAPIYKT